MYILKSSELIYSNKMKGKNQSAI